MHDNFAVIALLLAGAGLVGLAAVRFRQPLIIAFIGVGVAMGPAGLDLVQPNDDVIVLAEVGIAVLLFLVGLKLDLGTLRSSGPAAMVAGVLQIIITAVIGWLVALAIGVRSVDAIYVGAALALSSTIIIVKLLGDRRELEQQHGRLALGILIVQDLAVVALMIVVTAAGGSEGASPATTFVAVVVKGVALLAGLALVTRFLLPAVLHLAARSSELLVLFSVALAVVLAATSEWLGFSAEVGAFLAGVAIASTTYREAIASRLVSLRDFLLLFFFVELGAGLALGDAASQLWRAAVLTAFVLAAKPAIIMGLLGRLGYRRRTSFLTGISCAQVSEFSLILLALGVTLGQISSDTAGLVTLVAIASIAVSTYLIDDSDRLFERFGPHLGFLERSVLRADGGDVGRPLGAVVLFGLGRYGSMVARELCATGTEFTAIESDPQRVAAWSAEAPPHMQVIYGDAEDIEFTTHLDLTGVTWIVATMATPSVAVTLLHALELREFAGSVAVTAHTDIDADHLRSAGADVVLQPFTAAADNVLATLGLRPPPHDGG